MEECKMTNKKKNLGQYKYHLLYGVTHNVDRIYIGKHSTILVDDGYFGSGHWNRELLYNLDSSKTRKVVIGTVATEALSYYLESLLIAETKLKFGERCINIHNEVGNSSIHFEQDHYYSVNLSEGEFSCSPMNRGIALNGFSGEYKGLKLEHFKRLDDPKWLRPDDNFLHMTSDEKIERWLESGLIRSYGRNFYKITPSEEIASVVRKLSGGNIAKYRVEGRLDFSLKTNYNLLYMVKDTSTGDYQIESGDAHKYNKSKKYCLKHGLPEIQHNVLASFVDMSYANFFKGILNP